MRRIPSVKFSVACLVLLTSSNSFAIIGGTEVTNRPDSPAASLVALQLNYKDNFGNSAFKKATAVAIGRKVLLTAGHNL